VLFFEKRITTKNEKEKKRKIYPSFQSRIKRIKGIRIKGIRERTKKRRKRRSK
jgi:hypothetical protein